MKRDIVFLFGAGASFGVGRVFPYPPPLMCHLYAELERYFPREWGEGSQLAAHAHRFRDNFERTFYEEVLTFSEGVPRADTLTLLEKQVPIAIYFAQFHFRDTTCNLYYNLLDSLNTHTPEILDRCLFCSINYDCLFEQAASMLGLAVSYYCKEDIPEAFPILKLHGSCNFISKRLNQRDRATLAGTGVHYETDAIHLDPMTAHSTVLRKLSNNPIDHLPIMCQVSPLKDLLLAPISIQRNWASWKEAVNTATIIVIIGVSFNCNDNHIVAPIGDAMGTLIYIGDRKNFDKWKQMHPNSEYIDETFAAGFESLFTKLKTHIL